MMQQQRARHAVGGRVADRQLGCAAQGPRDAVGSRLGWRAVEDRVVSVDGDHVRVGSAGGERKADRAGPRTDVDHGSAVGEPVERGFDELRSHTSFPGPSNDSKPSGQSP